MSAFSSVSSSEVDGTRSRAEGVQGQISAVGRRQRGGTTRMPVAPVRSLAAFKPSSWNVL